MNVFSLKTWFLTGLPVVLLSAHPALAQVSGPGAPTGVNAAFVKLFGNLSTFTAKVETRVTDSYQRELVRMPMEFAALDSKVRLEINLAQIQSKDFTPTMLATLKQAGMDRMISVFRPDKKATYLIYPGVQSYQELPIAKGEAEAFEKGLTLEKSPLGKETIDGHACVKNKVTVKGGKGAVLEAVTWNATDLKDFPLQIEMKEKGNTMRMDFTQVLFVKPNAKQFDVPPTYGKMK
jgi:hypothetical protein